MGTLLWTSFLTFAGYQLGDNYKLVEKYIDPISKIALLSVVIFFLVWWVRKRVRTG
jgi:membrane protein DedA with SNARE-associated domain